MIAGTAGPTASAARSSASWSPAAATGSAARARSAELAASACCAPGANPPRSFYRRKKLKQGLNYVKVRDGVELAMTVRLPAGKTLADGPFPTLIEYSGYQVAAPNDLLSGRRLLPGATATTRSRRRPRPPSAR